VAPARMVEVKHGQFRRQELLQGLGMRTVLLVPIVYADEVTGVIECFFAGRPPADDSLLGLVSDVGHQIGVAYDRAERAAETRRRYVLGAMLRAEEEAKARLASDLHDDTIQVMVAAQLSLERISAAAHRSDLALVETAIGFRDRNATHGHRTCPTPDVRAAPPGVGRAGPCRGGERPPGGGRQRRWLHLHD
jgi:signal transduction histidine kinase